ncbi:hypothetical protein C8J56DRAFT_1055121 [Mycena floridula]|nr:hypothetical protein C8J56DRAFT_1055121 [Mycena floridula]
MPLPQELVELIIDGLESRHDLCSASLVARPWLRRSRFHLFACPVLCSKNSESFLRLLKSPLNTIHNVLDGLNISSDAHVLRVAELSHVPLRRLMMRNIPSDYRLLSTHCSKVTFLDWEDRWCTTNPDMLSFMAGFDSLESVSLARIDLSSFEDPIPVFTRSLRSLKLDFTVGALDWLKPSPDAVVKLSSLDIRGDGESLRSVTECLHACRESLTSLAIDHFKIRDLDLSALSHLGKFYLCSEEQRLGLALPILCDILDGLQTDCLSKITLYFKWFQDTELYAPLVQLLDQPKFHGIQELTLVLLKYQGNSDKERAFGKHFTRFQQRGGLLRVKWSRTLQRMVDDDDPMLEDLVA